MMSTNYPMIYRLEANMKRYVILSCSLIFALSMQLAAQDRLPVPDSPSSWVNDYAGVFSAQERQQLEEKLGRFQYRSSTQIFIVTVNDNYGYDQADLSQRIGERWGVGQKGKDNGLIILLDMMDQQVFIATGYGLEEYIPDAIAYRIIDKEMRPRFKLGDFYGGINKGLDVAISLLEGKFTPDEYSQQSGGSAGSGLFGIILAIIIFSMVFGGARRRSTGMGRSNLPLWIALGMMSAGSRRSGSFGSFSSGSGGFGGGGFGGFSGGGGGSFGGGGAGGGW